MIPCSEDIRTRMFNPRQSIRTPLDYEEQFERQLPPEVRAELEARLPAISRPPVRIPETEKEIQEAIVWLKSRGYLPPSPVQPPPAPSSVQNTRAPANNGGLAALVWTLIIGCILAPIVLIGMLASLNNSHPSTENRPAAVPSRQPAYAHPREVRRALPVDVRRALPAVRRAELVSTPTLFDSPSEPQRGDWHSVTLLDGTTVQACYQGNLASSGNLPSQGHFLGEEWSTGTGPNATDWIWLQPAGAHFASWVDP
jgi:hypothetical protein